MFSCCFSNNKIDSKTDATTVTSCKLSAIRNADRTPSNIGDNTEEKSEKRPPMRKGALFEVDEPFGGVYIGPLGNEDARKI